MLLRALAIRGRRLRARERVKVLQNHHRRDHERMKLRGGVGMLITERIVVRMKRCRDGGVRINSKRAYIENDRGLSRKLLSQVHAKAFSWLWERRAKFYDDESLIGAG